MLDVGWCAGTVSLRFQPTRNPQRLDEEMTSKNIAERAKKPDKWRRRFAWYGQHPKRSGGLAINDRYEAKAPEILGILLARFVA
jgi:hypothetical protein